MPCAITAGPFLISFFFNFIFEISSRENKERRMSHGAACDFVTRLHLDRSCDGGEPSRVIHLLLVHFFP